ncbi:MAG: right-handed parallel beta-helix repeat-containing protein [Saprospiraceae bacterium]|nr:right-handed parallel beta-helix repeat-containing protein [Saprospiraceae bacterium]
MRLTLLSAVALLLTFFACRKDENFTTDAAAKLRFSSDTLRFDTVFTSVGSATRYIKVFNPNNKPIKISKISLANKTAAVFNLNIDGVSGRSFTDVAIPANDSIYVFAEVTINPNAPLSTSPFVIAEDLIFETNGNKQTVVIEAWGQNANYVPNRWAGGKQYILDCGGSEVIWDDKKPYVIYGVLGIVNGTLRLPAGTHIYVHGGIVQTRDSVVYRDGILYVLGNAKIVSEGTIDKPVIIESDRLEKEFVDESDQWTGIILGQMSQGNVMTNTTIRNSRVGIRVDSAADLTLKSCKIYNTASSGLLAIHAKVTAENCLFYNNYVDNVQIEYGGDYTFNYCTMASFGSKEPALSANNVFCYDRDALGNCTFGKAYPLSMTLKNCIIYGSKEDEVGLYDGTPNVATDFNYSLQNCIVRVKDLLKTDAFPKFLTDNCKDCINAPTTAKVFRKTSTNDYHLDTLSIAEQKALPIPLITKDLDNKLRDVAKPDIGCYEFYPR